MFEYAPGYAPGNFSDGHDAKPCNPLVEQIMESFVQGDMRQNMRRFACSSFEHLIWLVCAKICAAMPADKNEANSCFTRHPSENSLYQVFARGHPPTSLERRASESKQNVHSAIQSSSLSHQPSAVSHQPSAFSLQPSASSQQPAASSQQPAAISHQPPAISPQPSVFSPQPFAFLFS